jgi:hypothetical protein
MDTQLVAKNLIAHERIITPREKRKREKNIKQYLLPISIEGSLR